MTGYALAQLSITDRSIYQRYQERFLAVMGKCKGQLLVADESPRVGEGPWDREKVFRPLAPTRTCPFPNGSSRKRTCEDRYRVGAF
jgi:hypothetical protein